MMRWDFKHTLFLIGTTLVGATAGYLEQQDASTLLAAIQSWSAMKQILMHIVVFNLVTLAALAKQSFLTPAEPKGGQGARPLTPEDTDPAIPAKRPGLTRLTRLAGLAACVIIGLVGLVGSVAKTGPLSLGTGCAAAIPIVGPVAALAACVAEHALNGDSLADIAKACKSDIPSIISALLDAKEPRVRESVAYGEAVRTRAIFVRDP
jgi:hypothetical protein